MSLLWQIFANCFNELGKERGVFSPPSPCNVQFKWAQKYAFDTITTCPKQLKISPAQTLYIDRHWEQSLFPFL